VGTLPRTRPDGVRVDVARAGSSLPGACVAEGCGHDTQKELARFLQIALASAHELHYHLRLAHDLDVLPATAYAKLDARTEQVKQMLSGLLRKVRGQPRRLEPRAEAVVT
jgi:four helix bundle protein